MKHGARVRFHQGTAEILGRVTLIGPNDDRPAVAPEPRRSRTAVAPPLPAPTLEPGARGFVRLRLESPAVLARGDRYIVRAYSPPMTIAGGVILDPAPPRTAIRTTAARDRLLQLDFDPSAPDRETADGRALAAMLDEAGAAALSLDAIVSRAGVDPADVPARVDALVKAKRAVRAGEWIVAADVVAGAREAVVAAVTEHHRAHPMSDGVPREELREQVFGRGNPAAFEVAIAELSAANRIVARDRVALATHRLALTPEEERARVAIERAYRDGGLKPPDASAVAADANVPPAVADRVVKLLQRQKVLVKVDVLLFHDEALQQLKAEVGAMKAAGAAAQIDVATFKERFGVTRKFAIPLLEYLDRERVTRRMGETRVVL